MSVLVDSNKDLYLYSYVECDNDSPEIVKKIRGIIRDENDNIIVPSFGYTTTFVDPDDASTFLDLNKDDGIDIISSLEGTLLRVYYHDGNWRVCTHNRLDAFRSRWSSSETYGEIFHRAIEEVVGDKNVSKLYEVLCPTRVYCFYVRPNTDNKIYWDPIFAKHKEKVLFIGAWESETFIKEMANFSEYEWSVLSLLLRPDIIKTYAPGYMTNDVLHYIKGYMTTINPKEIQGVLLWNKRTNQHVKILHPRYAKMMSIRGTTPNPRLRYLELRPDKIAAQIYYEDVMPEMRILFEQYEHIIHNIVTVILNAYIARFIKNQYVTLPKDEYIVMKKCHDWFIEDRVNNRINFEKVREMLEQETPLSIYKMIRRQQNLNFPKQPRARLGNRYSNLSKWYPANNKFNPHTPVGYKYPYYRHVDEVPVYSIPVNFYPNSNNDANNDINNDANNDANNDINNDANNELFNELL